MQDLQNPVSSITCCTLRRTPHVNIVTQSEIRSSHTATAWALAKHEQCNKPPPLLGSRGQVAESITSRQPKPLWFATTLCCATRCRSVLVVLAPVSLSLSLSLSLSSLCACLSVCRSACLSPPRFLPSSRALLRGRQKNRRASPKIPLSV